MNNASYLDHLVDSHVGTTNPMGIFGKLIKAPKEQMLKEGDRVEIYRPLIADPKEARAKRAAKVKEQKEG